MQKYHLSNAVLSQDPCYVTTSHMITASPIRAAMMSETPGASIALAKLCFAAVSNSFDLDTSQRPSSPFLLKREDTYAAANLLKGKVLGSAMI
jgi:hypothetical protein